MSTSSWDRGGTTVAGYFANADDAHHAINALLEEGFSSDQIGAAFHSRSRRPSSSRGAGQEINDVPIHPESERNPTPSGATSGTTAVSPWGLSSGGGTPFAGASRPGPITGSDIPSDIPREIPSEFASEHAYSGSAFESSFSGMGIPPEHARQLAWELGKGGAVVTVKAGSNSSTAEAVLAHNHGVVRYESAAGTGEAWNTGGNQDARVRVFGEVHRVYPGYVPGQSAQERKAS